MKSMKSVNCPQLDSGSFLHPSDLYLLTWPSQGTLNGVFQPAHRILVKLKPKL